jgi:hypothetical protein
MDGTMISALGVGIPSFLAVVGLAVKVGRYDGKMTTRMDTIDKKIDGPNNGDSLVSKINKLEKCYTQDVKESLLAVQSAYSCQRNLCDERHQGVDEKVESIRLELDAKIEIVRKELEH